MVCFMLEIVNNCNCVDCRLMGELTNPSEHEMALFDATRIFSFKVNQ